MAPSKWPQMAGSTFQWISGYLEQRSQTGNLRASRDLQVRRLYATELVPTVFIFQNYILT